MVASWRRIDFVDAPLRAGDVSEGLNGGVVGEPVQSTPAVEEVLRRWILTVVVSPVIKCSVLSAAVFIRSTATSDPDSGSVSPKQTNICPVTSRARHSLRTRLAPPVLIRVDMM